MRPVRLILQAFGPYPQREVIDFRDAVAAGLFGIYGQTGSGKSSIFSAMTFALFGKPAKEDQDPSSVRSDHAEAGLQTEVELVFDIGPRRYTILRRPEQMRPKQRGDGETRTPHEAFLFDATGLAFDDISENQRGRIIAEKKVGVVDAAITDMLGYGAEQFRQIVLLPQGRFETFLSANTKDRLGILRDLFDVSLYRTLAAKLKIDADTAERSIRQERELCARRLSAEGFDSTQTLLDGILAAGTAHHALAAAEARALQTLKSAETVFAHAQTVEAQFTAAEKARLAVAGLCANSPEIDRLAEQVTHAERARRLVDAETNVTDATQEVQHAEGLRRAANAASGAAEAAAIVAARALEKENGRASEMEDLRKEVDDLDRHRQSLAKSAAAKAALAKAVADQQDAARTLNAASDLQNTLKSRRLQNADALKAARSVEKLRGQHLAQVESLRAVMARAESFQDAAQSVQQAAQAVTQHTGLHDAAAQQASAAKTAFALAEQALTQVQALHLASKLVTDAPCPVCGATDHPAPATGAPDHAGRDQSFRQTKTAWENADAAARRAQQALSGAASVLEDRQKALAKLESPAASAAHIRHQLAAAQSQLDALGPQTDPAQIEAEMEGLDQTIDTQESLRDSLNAALAAISAESSARHAQLDEMLSTVPPSLRAPGALDAAAEKAAQGLAARHRAKTTAEQAAGAARDAALQAANTLDASDAALRLCKARHARALGHFQSRLQDLGLSEDHYQSLKPAIPTIEDDRARIADFRQRLAIAESTAKDARAAIAGQQRPDIPALTSQLHGAEGARAEATDLRAGTGHRLDQLEKLRDDLAETLQSLTEAEAASGPLRGLAALVTGDNRQKLDLETFAIGAMFDLVLAAANLRLGPMTANRYRLERDLEGGGRARRGLGIQVFDLFTGKPRPTATLSGGETFIAALALALGLADVVESASGKVRLDTIFIDEGFGSLDTENGAGTLDQVLQVLGGLVRQNRAVGLISHVPLVQEAIPNGFYVRKGLGGSHVEERRLR